MKIIKTPQLQILPMIQIALYIEINPLTKPIEKATQNRFISNLVDIKN